MSNLKKTIFRAIRKNTNSPKIISDLLTRTLKARKARGHGLQAQEEKTLTQDCYIQ